MIDVEKDIKVSIRINTVENCLAIADLTICGFIKIKNFLIKRSKTGKLYVINPHSTKIAYNKIEGRKEMMYVSYAELEKCEEREQIIDKILNEFGKEIDKIKRQTKDAQHVPMNMRNGVLIIK